MAWQRDRQGEGQSLNSLLDRLPCVKSLGQSCPLAHPLVGEVLAAGAGSTQPGGCGRCSHSPARPSYQANQATALIASWWVGEGHLSVGQVGLLSLKTLVQFLKASRWLGDSAGDINMTQRG